jgi:hypothetical protein
VKTVSAAHSSVALTPTAGSRYAGWSALASGGSTIAAIVALVVGPLLDDRAASALILILALVLFLGMIPIAMWLARSAAANQAGVAVAVGVIGVAGVLGSIAKALLVMPNAIPAVPAQILETSALGAIGLWLIVADPLALRSRSLGSALAILGIVAGLGWFLPAAIMWLDLTLGDLGSLTPVLEAIRTIGGMLAELLYTIWALWLGVRLVRR